MGLFREDLVSITSFVLLVTASTEVAGLRPVYVGFSQLDTGP